MKTVILDSSVVLKWLREDHEPLRQEALQIDTLYQDGKLRIVVPSLFFSEVLNVVSRKWRWPDSDVRGLGPALSRFNFEVREPSIPAVATWCIKGLSGYDATYAALAAETNYPFVTADSRLAAIAAPHAVPLAEFDADRFISD